jgi:hypothetical protein
MRQWVALPLSPLLELATEPRFWTRTATSTLYTRPLPNDPTLLILVKCKSRRRGAAQCRCSACVGILSKGDHKPVQPPRIKRPSHRNKEKDGSRCRPLAPHARPKKWRRSHAWRRPSVSPLLGRANLYRFHFLHHPWRHCRRSFHTTKPKGIVGGSSNAPRSSGVTFALYLVIGGRP